MRCCRKVGRQRGVVGTVSVVMVIFSVATFSRSATSGGPLRLDFPQNGRVLLLFDFFLQFRHMNFI